MDVSSFVIGIVVGLFVGATLGILATGLGLAAKDERERQNWRH